MRTEEGKDILILGLNYDQIPHIKKIKNLGFTIFGVDKNLQSPGRKYCKFYLQSSYTNVNKILKFLKKNKFSLNGYFFTAASQISLLALAQICESLKSKFINYAVIDKCIDKAK